MNHLTPESEQREYIERARKQAEQLKAQQKPRSGKSFSSIFRVKLGLEEQLAAKEQIVPVVPMHERGD